MSLEKARLALQQEIERCSLHECVEVQLTDTHLRIVLRQEERDFWIGHVADRGYFLVSDPCDEPQTFFELSSDSLLSLLPPTTYPPTDAGDPGDGAALLSSLGSDSPDVQQIAEIFQRAHKTAEGLDVVSTVAAIIARRNSISKLQMMLQNAHTPERDFR